MNKTENKADVQVTIQFPAGPYSKVVEIQYWFSSADSVNSSYAFLTELKSQIGDSSSFKFEPHYATWECQRCKKRGFKAPEDGCLSNGRYCDADPDGDGPLTGVDVLNEDIRQICIYKTDTELWWNYIATFSQDCLNKEGETECSQKTLEKLQTNETTTIKIVNCIKNSFKGTGSTPRPESDENRLLSEERIAQMDLELTKFPAILINRREYVGKLYAKDVFTSACDTFINPPESCRNWDVIAEPEVVDYSYLLGVGVLLLLISAIILFFYRRKARREMNKEMSIQISAMVSQYFTLTDETKGLKGRDNF